jgi:hypothetical protein
MSKKEENILDWLKEELALERIQVVIPPTDEQIKETIKELIKDPKMRNMLERVLIISTERKEYMKLLAFQLECSICNNNTTTHKFIEFEDSDNRLECLDCNHIGYIILKDDFNDFYVKEKIGLTELKFKRIE